MTRYFFCILKFSGSAACALLAFALGVGSAYSAKAEPEKKPVAPPPDVLVLSDGDTLHGKFVNEIGGKVTFHTDSLGDVTLTWDKIKELHTTQKFGLLEQSATTKGKHAAANIPTGTVDVSEGKLTVNSPGAPAAVPVAKAQYVMDESELRKQVFSEPGFFAGWNGTATAGANLVTASQNQYTVSGAVNMVRTVPAAAWLSPRNKTLIAFTGSFGKIEQPAYTLPADPTATPPTPATPVPAVTTKTAIFHGGAERDQYFSPRVYALIQTAFDHNFSQSLALQQIYGGGLGWTVVKSPKDELDLQATLQYETQQFIPSPATLEDPNPPAASPNLNLIGSTFAANYALHAKLFTLTQNVSYIPTYNQTSAYSISETNTVTLPAYKNFSFSVGTLDSYLNDSPITEPPTKPNSFQFTMGLTYVIKSKY